MRRIAQWNGHGVIEVAESAGGVLATVDPFAGLYRPPSVPWPPPEVLQKLYASDRWRGKTSADDLSARSRLGYYCDLQSLNSEDAITWTFFGPLVYGPETDRLHFATRLFAWLDLPRPRQRVTLWLWRRVPHPEKPTSSGGPEIDVGLQTESTLVLAEAKWNSSLGIGQGVEKNRTQLDLRKSFCSGLGAKGCAAVDRWIVLGIGRTGDVLESESGGPLRIANRTWREMLQFMPPEQVDLLTRYLDWKERYSSARAGRRTRPTDRGSSSDIDGQT